MPIEPIFLPFSQELESQHLYLIGFSSLGLGLTIRRFRGKVSNSLEKIYQNVGCISKYVKCYKSLQMQYEICVANILKYWGAISENTHKELQMTYQEKIWCQVLESVQSIYQVQRISHWFTPKHMHICNVDATESTLLAVSSSCSILSLKKYSRDAYLLPPVNLPHQHQEIPCVITEWQSSRH